jgi:hypothetical protein
MSDENLVSLFSQLADIKAENKTLKESNRKLEEEMRLLRNEFWRVGGQWVVSSNPIKKGIAITAHAWFIQLIVLAILWGGAIVIGVAFR